MDNFLAILSTVTSVPERTQTAQTAGGHVSNNHFNDDDFPSRGQVVDKGDKVFAFDDDLDEYFDALEDWYGRDEVVDKAKSQYGLREDRPVTPTSPTPCSHTHDDFKCPKTHDDFDCPKTHDDFECPNADAAETIKLASSLPDSTQIKLHNGRLAYRGKDDKWFWL